MTAEIPARCETCEQPHGTCRHTAAPFVVGDQIDLADMSPGRWVRAHELRANSRVRDVDGDGWVKTRRRDGAWEGARGDLHDLADIADAWGPLTIEHVAGRKAKTTTERNPR